VSQIKVHLLLALAVLVGSAVPLVPTGEMVSGAAAYAKHSKLNDLLIFAITWVCSVIGDTLMMLEARFGARWLRPRLQRSRIAGRVRAAEAGLTKNALNAILTGRLIPGGRTPVIFALGLGRFPIRRFVVYDVLACAVWAAVYSTLGSVGGRLASHPIVAMLIAIAGAVLLGLVIQQVRKVLERRRAARKVPVS
jgi:membrane protein DedA with SNARE-associated domain